MDMYMQHGHGHAAGLLTRNMFYRTRSKDMDRTYSKDMDRTCSKDMGLSMSLLLVLFHVACPCPCCRSDGMTIETVVWLRYSVIVAGPVRLVTDYALFPVMQNTTLKYTYILYLIGTKHHNQYIFILLQPRIC
jgi:hypothetical protein